MIARQNRTMKNLRMGTKRNWATRRNIGRQGATK